jgi:processive 1,2-diacylglycerol beta-glucosyltransferase
MIRIHLLCERFAGECRSSSYVRLLLPLGHPVNAAHFRLTHGRTYQHADVMIVERTWEQDPAAAEELLRRARRDRVCVIYSIDDDLLALGKEGPLKRSFMTRERIRVIELLARECDGIIVSTDRLKRKMLFHNNTVLTIPNALDERLFASDAAEQGARAPSQRRLVIGYMGTATHDSDLSMVAPALRRMLDDHRGNLELQLIGAISDVSTLAMFEGLPVRVMRSDDAMPYPEFMRWMAANVRWDFAISPLEDHEFNRCKSDVKFLDYGALGFPGIFSRTPAYEESVSHLETGYLADNTTRAWEDAIAFLASSAQTRKDLAIGARHHVLTRRTLRQNASEWRRAILAIAAGRRGATAAAPTVPSQQTRRLADRIQRAVCRVLPRESTVLVAGRRDAELPDFGLRRVWPFPQNGEGLRPVHAPADSAAAISQLAASRERGGQYLVVPATAFWWVDHYPDFWSHLDHYYPLLLREDSCLIYGLCAATESAVESARSPKCGEPRNPLRMFGPGLGASVAG